MKENKKDIQTYSLIKILLTDYTSFLAVMFPIAIFGMVTFIEVFGFFPDLKRGRPPLGTEAIPFFIQLGIITLVIGFLVIVFRTLKIKSYFDNGIEVKGKVIGTWEWKVDRGRIYFTYQYKNLTYENNMFVHLHRMTKVFTKGKKVRILLNPNNPKKAIIEDIFVKT
ncbi:hypothetical protein J4477_01620 [Candidatus Pacearchaeota archaeon]|nr:hypothetical protein [Candidatus Pacearchaeota archaeon]